jgi:gamma-glutamyltranspeptidase
MRKVFLLAVIISILLNFSFLFAQNEIGNRGSGKNGVIAAGKKEAVAAGIAMFEKDGNAADAAVASLLILSVKHIGAFCIGGEVPLIIYDAEKDEVKILSGQGGRPHWIPAPSPGILN